jgi:hypothetical protein
LREDGRIPRPRLRGDRFQAPQIRGNIAHRRRVPGSLALSIPPRELPARALLEQLARGARAHGRLVAVPRCPPLQRMVHLCIFWRSWERHLTRGIGSDRRILGGRWCAHRRPGEALEGSSLRPKIRGCFAGHRLCGFAPREWTFFVEKNRAVLTYRYSLRAVGAGCCTIIKMGTGRVACLRIDHRVESWADVDDAMYSNH